MKRVVVVLVIVVACAVLLLATVGRIGRVVVGLRSQLMQHFADNLPADVRDAMRAQILEGPRFWDAVPDPDVAGLGQPNRTVLHAGTRAHLNNAGMRSTRPYTGKPDSVFRIVCLGDSFVFGMGGPEEDRFCDQMAAFYREHGVTVRGREIQAYAVALPGWTLVQEATYLATRLTSYDPDLIIVLSVPNDITDDFGVTGVGGVTNAFSPEYRALGSAAFSNDVNAQFGDPGVWAALAWDLSPESRRRWDKAMSRLKRLVDLQRGRGKQVLVSAMVLGWDVKGPDAFAALFHAHLARAGVTAPFAMTGFRLDPESTLPHDVHPSRVGHRLLRDQYLLLLHRLGWVTVPDSALPPIPGRVPMWLDPEPDPRPYETFRRGFVRALPEAIDFTALRRAHTRGFLGGLFPEAPGSHRARNEPPWASVKTTFLLRRPREGRVRGVEVEVEIPARPELFPFALTLRLDGAEAGSLMVPRPDGAARHRITGSPVAPPFADDVIEVTLETTSYFSTIDDPRMKSYRLLRARAY